MSKSFNHIDIKKEVENLKEYISTDMDLKIAEFYYKEILPQKSNKMLLSPLLPIILSAFFAVSGTAFGAWLQGQSNLDLEKQKYESSLVLKMVETNNKKDAISNLEFALNLGLIHNKTLLKNIQKAIHDSSVVNIASTAYNAANDSTLQFLQRIQALKRGNDSDLLGTFGKTMRESLNNIKKAPSDLK